jgi:hypothetical protein
LESRNDRNDRIGMLAAPIHLCEMVSCSNSISAMFLEHCHSLGHHLLTLLLADIKLFLHAGLIPDVPADIKLFIHRAHPCCSPEIKLFLHRAHPPIPADIKLFLDRAHPTVPADMKLFLHRAHPSVTVTVTASLRRFIYDLTLSNTFIITYALMIWCRKKLKF